MDDLASNGVVRLAWEEVNKANLLTELIVEIGVCVVA
jgi:hypothetical protein